jgi:hypothetical protein
MIRIILPASLIVAGCTVQAAPEPLPASGPCNAAPAQKLLGQPADKVLLEAQTLSGAKAVRSYKTGSAVTMDYREDRLNIVVDEANRIVELKCG